jgi:hypothetical protein
MSITVQQILRNGSFLYQLKNEVQSFHTTMFGVSKQNKSLNYGLDIQDGKMFFVLNLLRLKF